jgi:hypothetical protein
MMALILQFLNIHSSRETVALITFNGKVLIKSVKNVFLCQYGGSPQEGG